MTWWPFSHPIDNIWSSSILHQYEFWKSIAFAFWSTIQHSFDDNVFSNKLSVSDTLSYFSVYLCNAEFSFTLGSVFGDEKTEKCKKFPKLGGGGRGVGIPTGGHKVFHRDVVPTRRSRCQDAFAPMRNDSIAAIFLSKQDSWDSSAILARSYGFPLKPAPPSHLSLQHISWFKMSTKISSIETLNVEFFKMSQLCQSRVDPTY